MLLSNFYFIKMPFFLRRLSFPRCPAFKNLTLALLPSEGTHAGLTVRETSQARDGDRILNALSAATALSDATIIVMWCVGHLLEIWLRRKN